MDGKRKKMLEIIFKAREEKLASLNSEDKDNDRVILGGQAALYSVSDVYVEVRWKWKNGKKHRQGILKENIALKENDPDIPATDVRKHRMQTS